MCYEDLKRDSKMEIAEDMWSLLGGVVSSGLTVFMNNKKTFRTKTCTESRKG
jgi:hypothetical protein